ncbi:hypothetical protein TCE0_034f11457, partial [Talaromyces pinophilus]
MASPTTPDYETMTLEELRKVDKVKEMLEKPPLRSFDISNYGRDSGRFMDSLREKFYEREVQQLSHIVYDTAFKGENFRNVLPHLEALYVYAQRVSSERLYTWARYARMKYVNRLVREKTPFETILAYKKSPALPDPKNAEELFAMFETAGTNPP